MKFKTIAEAFNYWNTKTLEEIETRAAEIKQLVTTDPAADMETLNIEISGLQQAKANLEERSRNFSQSSFIPLASMNFNNKASQEPKNGDVYASQEYRSAFFKSLLGRDLSQAEQTAMNRAQMERRSNDFVSTSNAAAIIPTQTLNEIIRKARTMGGIFSACRAFNMPSKIAIPVGTPSDKAAWHTEGAAVNSENNVPATVSFGAYEILKVFSISAAAETMTISAFENYLTDELAACVMATIEDSLVNGTGVSQGTGLLNTSGITSATYTKAGITYKDLVTIVPKLKRGYAAGAKWAMNNATLYNQIYGLVDANKRPVFIMDPKNESIGKILGFDVLVDDNLEDGTIIFGNFQYMAYNMPSGIMVDKSTQSSFRSGLIDYRAMALADTKCIVPEAFVVAKAAEA
ncbi:MAG: phage major capsid protein [Blautia sp.]|nr:phage major capsid protein [Blautia sp.]